MFIVGLGVALLVSGLVWVAVARHRKGAQALRRKGAVLKKSPALGKCKGKAGRGTPMAMKENPLRKAQLSIPR